MDACFVAKEGGYSFFRRDSQLIRTTLPQAYSVYLSGPDGNQAIDVKEPKEWVVVALYTYKKQSSKKQGNGNSVEMYMTVALAPAATLSLRPLPSWFEQAATDIVDVEIGTWNPVAPFGVLKDQQAEAVKIMKEEMLVSDSRIEEEINSRAALLQRDSDEASDVDGRRTMEGYIRFRVKRALLIINRSSIRDTLRSALGARDRMAQVLRAVDDPSIVVDVNQYLDEGGGSLLIDKSDAYIPTPSDYYFAP